MADNDMEEVKVHVDDGTTRGHDRIMTRKDAEKFMTYTPAASIVGDEAPSEEDAPVEEDDDQAESKAMSGPPANKSRTKAKDK